MLGGMHALATASGTARGGGGGMLMKIKRRMGTDLALRNHFRFLKVSKETQYEGSFLAFLHLKVEERVY